MRARVKKEKLQRKPLATREKSCRYLSGKANQAGGVSLQGVVKLQLSEVGKVVDSVSQ